MIFGLTLGKSTFITLGAHLSPDVVFRLRAMRMRFGPIFLATAAAALLLCGVAGASLIGIYRSDMESDSQRAQITKLSGERCRRGGSSHAFRIVVGKRTQECMYQTPVVGRDLEIAAVERLLSGTPKQIRNKAFLAVNLRVGGAGARYQLVVFPLQRKAQLRKIFSDGRIRYLHIEKNVRGIVGVNRANVLRLRAFNITTGPEKGKCRVIAFVGQERVADFTDDAAGDLQGRASAFSVGSLANAKGVVASVDNLVVRVPNPFE